MVSDIYKKIKRLPVLHGISRYHLLNGYSQAINIIGFKKYLAKFLAVVGSLHVSK
jgi:hypothetical protein